MVDYASFVKKVRERTGLPKPQADRAIEASLKTLAERISRGQAEDLALQLPTELRAPLLSGGEEPREFHPDEFIRRVAVREQVTEDEATDHVRAILVTLEDAVPDKEWRDTIAQLSADYADIVDMSPVL